MLDCVTQEDLDLIADAVITSGLKTVAVDPGVFYGNIVEKINCSRREKGEEPDTCSSGQRKSKHKKSD